jgi:hypothetical protein
VSVEGHSISDSGSRNRPGMVALVSACPVSRASSLLSASLRFLIFGLILVFSRVAQPRCRMPREDVVIRPVRAENGLFSPGTDLRLGKAIYSSFCQGDSAPLGCSTLSNCKNAIRSSKSDPKPSSMSSDDFLHCSLNSSFPPFCVLGGWVADPSNLMSHCRY